MKNLLAISICLIVAVNTSAEPLKFIIDDPKGTNVAEFRSKAAIEFILGQTNAVTGSIQFDPSDLSIPAKGKVVVDLTKVSTGIALRDEHMRSPDYLNTDVYPHAVFEFDNPVISKSKKMNDSESIEISITGKFTVHGTTKEITATGRATLFKGSDNFAKMGLTGDILHFDGDFHINLSDFNIKRPQFLVLKLSERQDIHIAFTATTGR